MCWEESKGLGKQERQKTAFLAKDGKQHAEKARECLTEDFNRK